MKNKDMWLRAFILASSFMMILVLASPLILIQASDQEPSLTLVPGPPPSGRVSLWADQYSIALGGTTRLYMWWEDVGCSQYFIVFYETYPDGRTLRFPSMGYWGPYPPPGPYRALSLLFIGDVAGTHYLYFQLYCRGCLGDYVLIGTSNTISIEVVKIKSQSSITITATPVKVARGDTVTISGSINPPVSARVTIRIVSPDGKERFAEVSSTSVGSFSYMLPLDITGTWSFQASWPGNDDYVGATSEWASVEVEARKYRITIGTVPTGLPITVDGVTYPGGGVFDWSEGSIHTLFVPQSIAEGSDKQYVFVRWTDGIKTTTRSLTVTGPASYTAEFKTQYLLLVISDYSETEGSGWYDEGTTVRASIKSGEIPAEFPWVYVFTGWSGDSTGNDLKSDPILMNRPKTANAKWEKRLSFTFYILVITTLLIIVLVVFIILKKRRPKLPPPP